MKFYIECEVCQGEAMTEPGVSCSKCHGRVIECPEIEAVLGLAEKWVMARNAGFPYSNLCDKFENKIIEFQSKYGGKNAY